MALFRLKPILIGGLVVFAFAGNTDCRADFTLSLDEGQTTVDRRELGPDNLIHNIDLLITHDGSDSATTFSGFTLGVEPQRPIRLLDNENPPDPLQIGIFAADVKNGLVSFLGSDADIGSGNTRVVTTLQFAIPAAAAVGAFPVQLTVVDAARGFSNITHEFSAASTSMQVAAVPEPGSWLLLAGASGLLILRRRMRRR